MEEKNLNGLCVVYGLAGWQRDHSQLGVVAKGLSAIMCIQISIMVLLRYVYWVYICIEPSIHACRTVINVFIIYSFIF